MKVEFTPGDEAWQAVEKRSPDRKTYFIAVCSPRAASFNNPNRLSRRASGDRRASLRSCVRIST